MRPTGAAAPVSRSDEVEVGALQCHVHHLGEDRDAFLSERHVVELLASSSGASDSRSASEIENRRGMSPA